MSQALINSINAYAKPDDLLIHLGDWSFSGINNIANFRRQLKVHDIIIATGNHDTHIQQNRLLTNCSYGEAKALGAKQNLNYADSDDVGAADLFMHVTPYLEISIDGQFIVLCHYPMASWNHSYKGSWMLHGHSHGSLFVNEPKDHWYKTSKIMDVGIDCAFDRYGEYKPFSIKEIREIMNKKSFRSVDHHNENTDK
jgi:calcineurin-like phosphoesterase family protein